MASDVESVNTALSYFILYSEASGAKLNLDKSVACIMAGNINLNSGPTWLTRVNIVKMCGVHFGMDEQRTNETSVRLKIEAKLVAIQRRKSPNHLARVTLINVTVLSKSGTYSYHPTPKQRLCALA